MKQLMVIGTAVAVMGVALVAFGETASAGEHGSDDTTPVATSTVTGGTGKTNPRPTT